MNLPALNPLYASIARRFLALFIDAIVLLWPVALARMVAPVLGELAVLFFYAPILESSEIQGTLGKYLVGIQITDLGGAKLSLRKACVRNLFKFISFVPMCGGFLFAFFTAKKQALHDILADTLVVCGRSESPFGEAWLSSVKGLKF